jgi:hypothetical protein
MPFSFPVFCWTVLRPRISESRYQALISGGTFVPAVRLFAGLERWQPPLSHFSVDQSL